MAQREAVEAADPLLCVIAGAGAGKTRVLTLRVARRIHTGEVEPDRVLVCTFSRKAADELRRRLWALDVGEHVRAGTFHRTALSLLRQHRLDRHLSPPSVLADRRSLLATIDTREGPGSATASVPRSKGGPARGRHQGGPRSGRPALVAQLDVEIGWAKARQLRPAQYAEAASDHGRRALLPPDRIAELYQRYEDARRRSRLLDFDDLLTACSDLLAADMAFADAVRWRFRHLYVDEMQDVNPAQFRLLTSLLGDEPDLTVVGDPNQSVYAFNGADPTLIERLAQLLPGTRTIRLDANHRCSPQVVAVAAAALGLDRATTSNRVGNVTSSPTSTRPDGPVPRITVHQSDAAEAEWVAHQVWLAHRPGRRWSQIAVLARTNAQLQGVGAALHQAQVPYAHAGGDAGPASDVRAKHEADNTPEPRGGLRTRFEDQGGEPDEDRVALTTFHRAKGLQWPAVFVVGLSAGFVPIASARGAPARDEERRLLYVALTRAEDELTCTWARFRGGPDEASGGERVASPWLDPVERTARRLEAMSSPVGANEAAARVAELKRRVGATPEGGPRDDQMAPSRSTTTGA
jgi:DNA helicase-2/ATP-dependent DNA helicase PcrA